MSLTILFFLPNLSGSPDTAAVNRSKIHPNKPDAFG
jgi:hypothetical protein